MADKKYQVFISSTYKDLIDERADIARSVLDLGHIPAAMEYFPAMDEEQLSYIKRIIDQCDYYVLVIAGKYGSLDTGGVSYTEREYDYAMSQGKFVLGFPIADTGLLPQNQTELDPSVIEKLSAFRKKVMSGRLVRTWSDRRDLDAKVVKGLAAAFQQYPQPGWVRTPETSNESLLSEINTLRKEKTTLEGDIRELVEQNRRNSTDYTTFFDEKFTFVVGLDMPMESNAPVRSVSLTSRWGDIFLNLVSQLHEETSRSDLKDNYEKLTASALFFGGNRIPAFTYGRIATPDFEVIVSQFILMELVEEMPSGNLRTSDRGKATYHQLRALTRVLT